MTSDGKMRKGGEGVGKAKLPHTVNARLPVKPRGGGHSVCTAGPSAEL